MKKQKTKICNYLLWIYWLIEVWNSRVIGSFSGFKLFFIRKSLLMLLFRITFIFNTVIVFLMGYRLILKKKFERIII